MEIEYTSIMKRGHDLEDEARECFAFIMGEVFVPTVYKNGRYSASLDGINHAETDLLELKCPAKMDKWILAESVEETAPYYFWQIVHQMYVCTKVQRAHFVVYDGSTIAFHETLTREQLEPYFEALIYCWEQFALYFDAKELPPKGFDPVDDQFDLYRDNYIIAKEEADAAKARLDIARDDLITLYGQVHARGIKVNKVTSKGSINYKHKDILARLSDLDLDDYRAKDKVSWRVTID